MQDRTAERGRNFARYGQDIYAGGPVGDHTHSRDKPLGPAYGLRYGTLPQFALERRFGETDDYQHGREDYVDFARHQIADWTPDAPFLAADEPRDISVDARGRIRAHFNGTRATNPDGPRHSEVFHGFTGSDNRGLDNVPRFDYMAGRTRAKTSVLTARMGNNDDNTEPERMWTPAEINAARTIIFDTNRANRLIFTQEKHNDTIRAFPGAATDGGTTRHIATDAEWYASQTGEVARAPVAHADLRAGAATEDADFAESAAVAEMRAWRAAVDPSAVWRHTVGDAPLACQRYAAGVARLAKLPDADALRHAKLTTLASADETRWASSHEEAARRVFGDAAARAALAGAHNRVGLHDAVFTVAVAAADPGGAGPVARDLAGVGTRASTFCHSPAQLAAVLNASYAAAAAANDPGAITRRAEATQALQRALANSGAAGAVRAVADPGALVRRAEAPGAGVGASLAVHSYRGLAPRAVAGAPAELEADAAWVDAQVGFQGGRAAAPVDRLMGVEVVEFNHDAGLDHARAGGSGRVRPARRGAAEGEDIFRDLIG